MAERGREVLCYNLQHRKKGSSSWKVSTYRGYLAGEANEGCTLVRGDGRASGNLVCVCVFKGLAFSILYTIMVCEWVGLVLFERVCNRSKNT